MQVMIEVPDSVAKVIGEDMRKPLEVKSKVDEFENMCRSIRTDEACVRATAEVLVQAWAAGRLEWKSKPVREWDGKS